MSTALRRLTVDEYLAFERASETKHEFFDGEMFAMAGGSRVHSLIAVNFSSELRRALRGCCRVYTSDLRVKSHRGLYTYPDVSVACGHEDFEGQHSDVLLNPALIVEVLSPSTEAYDRGKKAEHYRTIESLQTYVLVSTDHRQVEVFSRDEQGRWSLREFNSGQVEIPQPACGIQLDEIYADVEFPVEGVEASATAS